MGYSDSIVTLERRAALLGPLMEGQETEFECDVGSEKDTAYQIRECFHIARKNAAAFPGLAKAAKTMTVEIQGEGLVVVRERRLREMSAPGRIKTRIDAVSNPKKHLAEEVSLIGEQTTATIVDSWIKAGSQGIMHFPQANLAIEDLKKLHQWATAQNVLLFWKDPMVTVRVFDPELAPYSFDPEEDLP